MRGGVTILEVCLRRAEGVDGGGGIKVKNEAGMEKKTVIP